MNVRKECDPGGDQRGQAKEDYAAHRCGGDVIRCHVKCSLARHVQIMHQRRAQNQADHQQRRQRHEHDHLFLLKAHIPLRFRVHDMSRAVDDLRKLRLQRGGNGLQCIQVWFRPPRLPVRHRLSRHVQLLSERLLCDPLRLPQRPYVLPHTRHSNRLPVFFPAPVYENPHNLSRNNLLQTLDAQKIAHTFVRAIFLKTKPIISC